MTLAIAPTNPAVATLAPDLGIALQPGTVVSAQVLQVLDNELVRIAIASLNLDVSPAKPLQQGQSLQLVAESATGLTLTPVTSDTPNFVRGAAVIVDDAPLAPRATNQAVESKAAMTPQEARTVAVAAQTAVTKQTGLSPLFANLGALSRVDLGDEIPEELYRAVAEVLVFVMRLSRG